MSDAVDVYPCSKHQSLLRMPEFDRVVQIATDCPDCYVEEES